MTTKVSRASLFERLGGEAALMSAGAIFYEKAAHDPLVGEFFVALDMEAQTTKLVAFLSRAFNGPAEYRGRDLRTAHAALVRDRGLGEAHFDRIARLLDQTLQELHVPRALIDEVLAIVAGTKAQVLGGPP